MGNARSLRRGELDLSSYGSPLRRPVVDRALVAALLALIVYNLKQIMLFFTFTNPDHLMEVRPWISRSGS
jgi:hypothetical protein